MNEHSFVKSVHRLLPKEVYRWKIHDKFTGGVPDAYYEGPKGYLWIEYKYLKTLPKRTSTSINLGLSPLQISWLSRAVDNKIDCMVVVGHEKDSLVLRNKRWTQPINTDYYNSCRVSTKHLARLISQQVTGTYNQNETTTETGVTKNPTRKLEQDLEKEKS